MRKGSQRSRSVIAFVVLGAAASAVACSTAEEEKKDNSSWTCEKVDVPGGETVRCIQGSAIEVPAETAPPSTDNGNGGSVGLRTYDTPPPSNGGSSSGGSASNGDSNGGGTAPGTTPYDCKPGMSGPDCPPAGGTSSAPPAEGNEAPGPDECKMVPDLPYCGGGAGGGAGGGTAGGGTAGGGAAGGDTKCTKDMKGNKVCETPPTCAPGMHPGACGACIEDGTNDDCVPPSEGGCWVTGGGFIIEPSVVPGAPADGHDNYGGNAKQMKKGGVSGHWNHVDHGTMNHAKGRPEYLFCRHVDEPGPGQPGGKKGLTSNQVYFGGHAEWRVADQGDWQSGYWFDVVAKDHGEPGSQPSAKNGFMVDTYHFTIRKMDDPQAKVSGPIVYEVKGPLVGGNIQIHPSNNGHPGIQYPPPPWVGLEP